MPVDTKPVTGASNVSLGNICIFGAGCIGCFVGICLADNGQKVTFLHRKSKSGESFYGKVCKSGIRLKDHYGNLNKHLDASTCASAFTLDCERALRDADVILVATKRVANKEVSLKINQFAKEGVPVVTLQNGTCVRKQLAPFLNDDHPIIECMVNVAVVTTPEGFAKTSPIARFVLDGDPETLTIAEQLATALKLAGVKAEVDADIKAVQYGKLMVNLVNPINALSGLPLNQMLFSSEYRLIIRFIVAEALSVYRAAGITPKPSFITWAPRLLDILHYTQFLLQFLLYAAQFMLRKNILDDTAHSSMWEDFKYGRMSEIDFLNGEIVRLGKDFQVPTPYNDKLVRNVKQHEKESGGLPMVSATMMASMLGVKL